MVNECRRPEHKKAPFLIKPLQPPWRAGKTGKPGLTVSRLKGRPFYGQAMGQLRLTCTFSAECAQPEEMHPYPRLRRYFHLKVKRLTTFCASLSLLQNVFAVHPGGGSLPYAYPSRRTRHSERQRRISVYATFETNGNKYQSAEKSHLRWLPPYPASPDFSTGKRLTKFSVA